MDIGGLVQGGGQLVQAASLSEADEPAMGEAVVCAVTNRYRLSTDEKLNRYVNLVGLTVASTCPRQDIEFSFGVLETNEVNAYSGPSGYVLITRGALRQMADESELAGVLAHEMGHIILRHGFTVTQEAMKTAGLTRAAQSVDRRASQFGGAIDALADVALKTGWAQPQEFEADAEAVYYLVNANYDPTGFERFLEKLESSGGGMSTHPGKQQRIAKVSQLIDELKARGKGQTLRERFVKNVGR
jgi:beta-barrel assembly-enhancing protease